MNFFQHSPSGRITVGSIQCTLEEWLKLEPKYIGLTAGQIMRRYEPKKVHYLTDGQTQVGGPMPWKDGDRYLSKQEKYKTLLLKMRA